MPQILNYRHFIYLFIINNSLKNSYISYMSSSMVFQMHSKQAK